MKPVLYIIFSLVVASAYSQKTEDFHLDKEYKMDPNGTIKMTTSDARVTVVGSRRTTAHVKIDREISTKGIVFGHEEFTVNVNESDGNIEIRERANSVSVGMIGYRYEKYTILVEVPEGTSLTVKGDDGDYKIKNIGGAISLRVDDADVELTACKGDRFEFRMDDGDLKMDQGRGSIEITGDDTDVHIQNAAFTALQSDLDDGDLVIETSIADNGNYFIKSQDGLVSMTILGGGGNFDIKHEDGRVTMEGNFKIVEKSDDEMQLSLAEGKANVTIRADDARIRLAVK